MASSSSEDEAGDEARGAGPEAEDAGAGGRAVRGLTLVRGLLGPAEQVGVPGGAGGTRRAADGGPAGEG